MPSAQRTRNEKIKALRLALRMSQNEFATAVRQAGDALGEPNKCTKQFVQGWESGGRRVCPPNYRRALQRVTRTPYIELGFADAAKVTQPSASIIDLLGSTSALSDGVLLLGEPSDALRYALTRPEVANSETVDLIVESTAYLFGLEYTRSARVMMPMVERHIRDIAAMLAGTRHRPLRRRLAVAGGQAAALGGWLAFDLGDTVAAHRYWDGAMASARYAADGALVACVLAYLSYSAADRGDPHTAWQLAHAAISHAESDARAQAWMAVRAAQEAAQVGDSGAALAELELALDYSSDMAPAAPEDDAEPWCRFVDRSYIWAMVSNVHTRLGAADDAYAAAIRALDSLSSNQVKTRAIVLAEAAHAFVRIGGTERAIQCATEAAEIASRLEFTLAERRVRALMPMLSRDDLASQAALQLLERLDLFDVAPRRSS